ncbi:hypothetical protein MMC21_001731 [Puttea exsequens]|nr:hypothetical protein [Puttea exsequens]
MSSSQAQPPSKIPNPQLRQLQQPEKLSEVLKDDYDDCTACRLTGAAAFIGLGGYIFYSGQKEIAKNNKMIAKKGGNLRLRLAGIGMLASSFVGMGLYRLAN